MLENGLNGFPRACRSARARGPVGKKVESVQNHSFEILASVAGKLLDNGDKFFNSCSSNYAEEQYCSCDELEDFDEKPVCSDRAREDFDSGISSVSSKSKELGEMDLDKKSKVFNERKGFEKSTQFSELIGGKDRGISVETTREFELRRNRKRSFRDETGSSGDEKTLEGKRPGLAGFLTCHASNVRVVRKDKDEISRGAIQSTKSQEMKKISLTAMDDNHCSADGSVKEVYDDKQICHSHEGSQKIYPYKKRKFFDFDSLSTTDGGFKREGVSIPSDKRINGKTCTASQRVAPNSKDCNVKLSIKSFKVPELFIDISTNATVGSLKRTVMEAVTSILGDGLHVGILVRGKKVRDDNKTLIQTGISQYDKCDNLGFVLEPNNTLTATSMPVKSEHLMPKKHGVTRHSEGTTNASLHRPVKSLGGGCVESDKTNLSCKSIVPVPQMSMEPLAVAPLARKSGHHEYAQRRIRRPFSVSEVEALVRAVEKLGTGRWRDVKFHAFDNAKHRTYVDLKDKWKTLVHTARISPQQRRGEPVPQELLDQVLAAQSHWSHSHRPAKQHARISA